MIVSYKVYSLFGVSLHRLKPSTLLGKHFHGENGGESTAFGLRSKLQSGTRDMVGMGRL